MFRENSQNKIELRVFSEQGKVNSRTPWSTQNCSVGFCCCGHCFNVNHVSESFQIVWTIKIYIISSNLSQVAPLGFPRWFLLTLIMEQIGIKLLNSWDLRRPGQPGRPIFRPIIRCLMLITSAYSDQDTSTTKNMNVSTSTMFIVLKSAKI